MQSCEKCVHMFSLRFQLDGVFMRPWDNYSSVIKNQHNQSQPCVPCPGPRKGISIKMTMNFQAIKRLKAFGTAIARKAGTFSFIRLAWAMRAIRSAQITIIYKNVQHNLAKVVNLPIILICYAKCLVKRGCSMLSIRS